MQLTALADVGIYEGPGLPFLIALNSTAVMRKGATLIGDAVLVGQCYNGDVRWFHRVDGVGFVPWAIVRQNRMHGRIHPLTRAYEEASPQATGSFTARSAPRAAG